MSAQRCGHAGAVPVESGGETVAALCPACDLQLPARWLTCRHETMEVQTLGDPPGQVLCVRCGVIYWEDNATV